LAHEFSHIKLLGENRMQENHEHLTDLFTVVFGLGIFNANASFKEIKTADSWDTIALGTYRSKNGDMHLPCILISERKKIRIG
jgi:hypothetical protein